MINTEPEGKTKGGSRQNDTKYLGGDIGNYIFLLTPAITAIQIGRML